MLTPDVVARCVAAMKETISIPVTVKRRIGVDDQDTETALDALADQVLEAGADALWVHARKAWLKGLSPKENREIPPLDYEARLSSSSSALVKHSSASMAASPRWKSASALAKGGCGYAGRAAYHNPALLAGGGCPPLWRGAGTTSNASKSSTPCAIISTAISRRAEGFRT